MAYYKTQNQLFETQNSQQHALQSQAEQNLNKLCVLLKKTNAQTAQNQQLMKNELQLKQKLQATYIKNLQNTTLQVNVKESCNNIYNAIYNNIDGINRQLFTFYEDGNDEIDACIALYTDRLKKTHDSLNDDIAGCEVCLGFMAILKPTPLFDRTKTTQYENINDRLMQKALKHILKLSGQVEFNQYCTSAIKHIKALSKINCLHYSEYMFDGKKTWESLYYKNLSKAAESYAQTKHFKNISAETLMLHFKDDSSAALIIAKTIAKQRALKEMSWLDSIAYKLLLGYKTKSFKALRKRIKKELLDVAYDVQSQPATMHDYIKKLHQDIEDAPVKQDKIMKAYKDLLKYVATKPDLSGWEKYEWRQNNQALIKKLTKHAQISEQEIESAKYDVVKEVNQQSSNQSTQNTQKLTQCIQLLEVKDWDKIPRDMLRYTQKQYVSPLTPNQQKQNLYSINQ